MTIDDGSMTTGNGPGDQPVGIAGVISLGVYCIVAFLICGSALIELWPHPTPAGTPPKSDTTSTSPKENSQSGSSRSGADSSGTVTATSPAPPPAAAGAGGGKESSATPPTPPAAAGATGKDSSAPATMPGSVASAAATHPAPAARPTTTTITTTTTTGTEPPPNGGPAPDATCVGATTACANCELEAATRRARSTDPKSNDPECVHLWWTWLVLWQEERLLLIVLLAGALGALLHAVSSFTTYVGLRKLVRSWVAWYVLNPFVGAFLAAVFYLTIRGGFFSSNASVSATSPFGFAAVAALVGMFSRQATEKLRKIFESLFTTVPPGPEGVNPSKPVLQSVTGTITRGQAAQVTLNGSGFAKTSKAHLGAQELATVWVSDKQLKADVPANLILAAGPVTFTVVTPPPGGGTSDVQTVVVQ